MQVSFEFDDFFLQIICFDVANKGVVCGTNDRKLLLFQNETWRNKNLPELATVVAMAGDVNRVAFALQSGKIGINCGQDLTNENEFQILKVFSSHIKVTAMHFGDQMELLIGTENGFVSVLNCQDFSMSRILDLTEPIVQIQVMSPNLLVSSEKVSIICNTEMKVST